MNKFIRIAKTSYIIISIILCILGLVLMINPAFSQTILVIMCAILLIVFGMIKLFGYFSNEARKFGIREWYLILIFAVLACICGITLMVKPSESGIVLTILLGANLLVEGILSLITVITSVKIFKEKKK